MERKEIYQKIADLTELISINNNRLFLHDEKIAQLEIDLLRKNVIELYEQINWLHITNLRMKDEATLTKAENDVKAIEPDEEIMAMKEEVVEPEIKEEPLVEKPQIVEEPKVPEIIEIPLVIEEKPEPQTKLFEVVEEKRETAKNPIVAEKPQIEKTEKTNVYEKYRQSKIDSIKKSISILKKYEYQNQLFDKDPKAYADAIEMLDQAAGLDVALSLFENSMAKKYNWPKDDSLVEELKELVLRRHS